MWKSSKRPLCVNMILTKCSQSAYLLCGQSNYSHTCFFFFSEVLYPCISCWSEEVQNFWPQCVSDLVTNWYVLKTYCILPGDKNRSCLLKSYRLQISDHGMHFQCFRTTQVFLNPHNPQNCCNGLLLQHGISNSGLSSYMQQSPVPEQGQNKTPTNSKVSPKEKEGHGIWA